jgi:hypothetical protein
MSTPIPGNGFVAEPGLSVVMPGNGVIIIAPVSVMPPRVDDRAAPPPMCV